MKSLRNQLGFEFRGCAEVKIWIWVEMKGAVGNEQKKHLKIEYKLEWSNIVL